MKSNIVLIMAICISSLMCYANTPPLEPIMETTGNPPPPDRAFFILYSVGNDALNPPCPLPDYWSVIWDKNNFPSVTGFYYEVTRGQLDINAIPLGTNGASGGDCFYIYDEPTPTPPGPTSYSRKTILAAANVYDFRPYADENGYIYGAIVIPPVPGIEALNRGVYIGGSPYNTGQFLPNGKEVKFQLNFISRTPTRNTLIANCCHEYGHNWFPDMGYWGHYNLGGYDVMQAGAGYMGFWSANSNYWEGIIPSPFNPHERINHGWLEEISIFASRADFHIKDIADGKAYRINTGLPDQFFILTNHQRISQYEVNWPGSGLMIWHVYKNGSWTSNKAPLVDLECAYGLWDWHFGNSAGDTFPVNPNPIFGLDSFDIGGFDENNNFYGIYGGYLERNIGGLSDFYPGPKNLFTSFTPISNPSSNLYDIANPQKPESIISGVKITNIRKDPLSNDMIIDVDLSEVPPTPPSGLSVVLSEWPYNALLSWQANSEPDVVGYEVWRDYVFPDGTIERSNLSFTTETNYQDAVISPGKTYTYYVLAVDADGNRSYIDLVKRVKLAVPQYISNQFATTGNTGRKLSYMPGGDSHFALCYQDIEGINVLVADKAMNQQQYLNLGEGSNPTLSITGSKGNLTTIINVAAEYNALNQSTYYGTAEIRGYKQPWVGGGLVYPCETHILDGGAYNRRFNLASMSSPSMVLDKNGCNHLVWESYWGSRVVEGWLWTYSVKYCKYDANWNRLQDIETIHSETWLRPSPEPEPRDTIFPRSACIAVDVFNKPHVVWSRNDEVYYTCRQNNNWTPCFNLSDDPENRPAKEPFIETYYNTITAAWVEDVNGVGDVFTRFRPLEGNYNIWYDYFLVSSTPTLDTRHPQVIGRDFYVFYEDNNLGQGEIFMRNKTDYRTWNMSNTSNVKSHGNQMTYRVIEDNERKTWKTFHIWTEGDHPPFMLKYAALDISDMPHTGSDYFVPVADAMASPYTIARDGFIIYPSGIGVDYDSTAVAYSIPVYDTSAEYDLFLVGYHETSGEWRQMVELDGKWSHQMKFVAGQPETLRFRIPPAFKKDGIIDIAIKRKNGDYAAVAGLGLYVSHGDTSSSGGGAQSAGVYGSGIHNELLLIQNAPNPVALDTRVTFQLPCDGQAILNIYNIAGQKVKTLVEGLMPAGRHEVIWDGRDERGNPVSAGVYFYRLDAGGRSQSKKMTVIR